MMYIMGNDRNFGTPTTLTWSTSPNCSKIVVIAVEMSTLRTLFFRENGSNDFAHTYFLKSPWIV